MANRRINALLNVALLGVSLVAGMGVIEVALRLFPDLLPESAQLRVLWNEVGAEGVVSERHPTIGFVYPANYSGVISGPDFHSTYTTDENGFRNRGPWPDSVEIVALGDSQTFGYGASDDESWPSVLDQALPERVLNLGLIGGSPQQYQRIYETFGVSVHPKLVVFGLFSGNDIDDARTFQTWLDAGGEGNYDVWRAMGGRPPDAPRGWTSWARSSYLAIFLRETKNSFGYPIAGQTIEMADGSRLRLAPSMLHGQYMRARTGEPDFELVMEAVRATRAAAEAGGAEFLVLIIPTKEETYLPTLGRPVSELAGAFAQRLEADGIPTLDLTPTFRVHAAAGETLFFEVDGHANARGYRLMAEVLMEYLEANVQRYAPSG